MIPRRLRRGDTVRLVSPASTPSRASVEAMVRHLETLGLEVELGQHVFDRHGYLAGTDDARLSDLDDALRAPHVRAIVATRGGKGAYRIASSLDFDAAARDPKPLVGFSEITILHLALYRRCGLPGVHGAAWTDEAGRSSAESFERAVFGREPVTLTAGTEPTVALTTQGTAEGVLIGGNQDMVATAAGWALPDLDGAILLLEAAGMQIGQIDRQLTLLRNGGHLSGVRGVAIGQYTDCGRMTPRPGKWTALDVLRDHLRALDVPLLGGLPVGHGPNPLAVPVGTLARLDCDRGTLTVDPAVR